MNATADSPDERCVGCGFAAEPVIGPVHRYMTSSPACWAGYGELMARVMGEPTMAAHRQYCVDAYAVQHPGNQSAQAIQSVAVHLVVLYAYLEMRHEVAEAPQLLQRAVQRSGQYRWLEPPAARGTLTARDILRTSAGSFASMARRWATEAWQAWESHHDQIREWYAEHVKA